MEASTRPGFWHRTGVALGWVSPSPEPAQVRAASGSIAAPARDTSPAVTVETALSIGAVYRAVSIIVGSVSQMDLTVVRRGKRMDRLPALIRTPNVYDTQTGFVEETVYSLATRGNAYWRLRRSSPAEPVQSIDVMDPSLVSVNLDQDTGRIAYGYNGRELARHEIKHLRLMRRPGHAEGLGPIQAATGEIAAALRLRRFADTWFDSAGVPTGTLSTDMVLSPQESAEFADAWKAFLKEHDGVAVLSQGLKYAPVHIKPAEAQFLEVQKESVVAVARLFGIPVMHMLAEQSGTSNTYLNLEQANIVFLQTTLARYMTEIENALTDLLPAGQRVQFAEEQLLRMDSKSRWDVRKIQLDTGARSVDEIRAEDNLEPLPEPKPAPAPPTPADTPEVAP